MRWYSSQVEGWPVGRLVEVLALVGCNSWHIHTDNFRSDIIVGFDVLEVVAIGCVRGRMIDPGLFSSHGVMSKCRRNAGD